VSEHHGDILKFAGDAVTVAWFLEHDFDESLPAAVALAAQCAIVLQVFRGFLLLGGTREQH
jgi:class 3 adenylate cyclase